MRILILILALLCSGCLQDDVSDLTYLVEKEQQEIYRAYYQMGVEDGLMMMNVPKSDAAYWAELKADEVFNGL